jgi:hypothetical protein
MLALADWIVAGAIRMKIPEAFRDTGFQMGFFWGLSCGLLMVFIALIICVLS